MNVSYIRAVFLFIAIESVSLNAYFITYLMLSIEEKPNLSPPKICNLSFGVYVSDLHKEAFNLKLMG